jgi:hypothetical protein
MNTRNWLIITLIAAAIFSCGTALQAGEEEKIHKMFHVQIKPGHADAYYAALAEHCEWRREQGDPWTWWIYTITNGQDVGDCVIRSGPITWADMDSYEEFLDKGSTKYWEAVGEHVEDITSWIATKDTRFERWHPEMEKIQYVTVIEYKLKSGKGKAFGDAVKVYHDAITEHDYPTYYIFDWVVNGGEGSSVTLAVFHENYADMAPPEERMPAFMARVLGEEGAAEAYENFTASVKTTSSKIVKYLPELSVLHPKEESAEEE